MVPALINDLLNRGVAVHILNMGLIDNTPTGKLITNILLAFAEYERDIIVERTQAGKEIARTKEDFCDGSPPIDPKRKAFAADLILNQHLSYKKNAEVTGLSKSTLILFLYKTTLFSAKLLKLILIYAVAFLKKFFRLKLNR